MRLTNIKVRNYRSYFSEDPGPSVETALAQGVNYIAGPNNSGKSNLLRAVALALDPKGNPYIAERDRPQGKRADTQTTITLEFQIDGTPEGPIATLVKRVESYEQTVPGFNAPSYVSQGTIRFHVQCGEGHRQELFLASGAGARKGDPEALEKALSQFRKIVRFVDIRSGEELRSLLERGFKEVLGTVVGEEHSAEIEEARKHRDAYVEALGRALRPLARHVQDRIRKYVRDVEEVDLWPVVPSLEDSIAGARFMLKDAVTTDLEAKGTGVRGATLLMLMSFIAESSRRAVVFSIEEPESFLHPEAHRALGNGLDGIAVRPDVSVLVTTHSPFLLRDDGHGRSKVFDVRKNASGRSLIAEQRVQAVRATLLGSQVYADLLGRAEQVRDDARLILVVEGWTDMRYLEIAAKLLGKSITHLDIVIAEGAMPAAMSVTSLRSLTDADRPVVVLFDDDEEGRRAHGALDKWSNKIVRLKYDKWVPAQNVAVEAEDLFSNSLLERFLNEVGRDDRLDGQNKRPGTSTWHYSLTDKGKTSLVEWLPTRATANECGAWGKLIEHLDSLIADAERRAARRRAHPGGDVSGS